jgi:prophage regulatory protein
MAAPKHGRILRLPQVLDKTGLRRDSIYRGAREGWFPRPIKLNSRASGWIEREVDEFIAKRAAERDTLSTPTAPPPSGTAPKRTPKMRVQPARQKKLQRASAAP